MEIGTIASLPCEDRTVLLRLDLNSPIDPGTGAILDDKRFREHLPTLRALDRAKVVILTHQSRPGKKDYTPLAAHARKLGAMLGKPVGYVEDVFGACARDAVAGMAPGDVLMLENVRFNAEENLSLKPEDAAKTILVKRLAGLGDFFVNDAFGTAHRSQPTVVGLPMLMRSAAGLLMEREVSQLSRVFAGAPRPVVVVLGGTKVDDSIDVARHVLGNGVADTVVAIGVVANIFYLAQGLSIGGPSRALIEQLKYMPLVDVARELLATYGDRIVLPSAVAVRENGARVEYPADKIPADAQVMDAGAAAVAELAGVLSSAGTVVFNGPAGVFEDPAFALGTHELLKAAAEADFSVIGGGHTAAVVEKLGIDDRFTHISTGGGACIEFLTGKTLPAVDALARSRQAFG
ncbi:MAG TPA: phosphoglycerate kinase [Methanoregulaceae archaeon]|nr:phosphoglycerate kinase [Methanoregulaceae archaeon]